MTKVYFSPGPDCLNAIRDTLRKAKRKAKICVFTISDNRIVDAIKEMQLNGVNIKIISDNDKRYDEGNDIDILALSSGELARVNTSTLLAIRKLMSTLSKSKMNVLFLDEVISVLDDEGKERLIEVLLKEQELNTFLVSHGWTHPLLTKATIVKENNISRLEWQ